MPCSHPIVSYTNAKYLYRGVNRWRNMFSCGKCEACNRKNRAEWRLRTYYEAQRCLHEKGFVLFDTLTYCDDAIKKYSDVFPEMDIPFSFDYFSFSRDDVQKFFKRLRTNLKRHGYDVDKNMKYILSSEYGSSEQTDGFKNTHRPHYHLLFFVNFDIEPIDFSRIVSRSWICGKTDGVRPSDDCSQCPVKKFCKGRCIYQSPQYVMQERLIKVDSTQNCMKCVNYVTKYISKDLYNYEKLSQRVDDLFYSIMPGFNDDYEQLKLYRRFCRQVLPFHLQSQNFGLYALNVCDKQLLENYNKITFPSGEIGIYTTIPLPRYLERKLYYNFVKIDGRVHWYLKNDGINAKLRFLQNRINAFIADYRMFDNRISDDRLSDLALYACVYRGTLARYSDLLLPYKDYYRRLLMDNSECEPLFMNNNTEKDKFGLGKFLSSSYYVTPDGEIIYKGKQLHKEFNPPDGMVVVNDRFCDFWQGFDKRLELYYRWQRMVGNSNDLVSRHDAQIEDVYKQLGLLK